MSFFKKSIKAKELKSGQMFKRFNDVHSYKAEVVAQINGMIKVFNDGGIPVHFLPDQEILIRE